MKLKPDELKRKLNQLKVEKRAFINNKFMHSLTGKTFNKLSPVDDSEIEGIVSCQEEDIELAVETALNAYHSRVWVDKPLKDKKEMMLRLADKMEKSRLELSLLDCWETGRALKNFYYDSIPKAIEVVRWFAEASDKLLNELSSPNSWEKAFVERVPIGVIACITPWNDPLVPALWKMIPGLLTGNCVIMKPAEESTLSLLKVASFLKDSGLPAGVLQVLPGKGEVVGKYLAQHKDIRGVFFTGSTETGKKIMNYASQVNLKKVGLECGGKSFFIITKKSNKLKLAARVLAKNIFYNQGQICSAPSIAYVPRELFKAFVGFVSDNAQEFIPGAPFDLDSDVATLVSSESKERIEKMLKDCRDDSEELIELPNINNIKNSLSPVILLNTSIDSELFKREIFGPVLIINSYDDINEVVRICNNSEYGLAASVWSDDLSESFKLSSLIEAGIVHINSYGEDDMTVPFGGVKQSGIGREKSLQAFDEYSEIKTTWIKID